MTAERLEKMLHALLTSNADIPKAWSGIVPAGEALPAVVYSLASASDVIQLGPGGGQILVRATYLVKAVGQASGWGALSTLASAIDSTLDGADYQADGYRIEVRRERPIAYVEEDQGRQYRHIGGYYTVYMTAA